MRILFQGDSITDAGRSREDDGMLGYGYPRLIEAELGLKEPTKYEFLNRGISGNRIVDLYARMKCDILNLKPDVLSILIGVNDVWHELHPSPNGVDTEKFYNIYDMLIAEIKEALPDVKIILLEPFCLKASSTEANWDWFSKEVPAKAEKAKAIALKYNLPYVELQKGFDALTEVREAGYWLRDGVHPTAKGHAFIMQEWLKAFNTL